MEAELAFPDLARAVRALKSYTDGFRRHLATRTLYLRTHGDTFTLGASAGGEVAEVDLPGASVAGACAIHTGSLIGALAAARPAGKATATATVRLEIKSGRLRLTGTGGPTITQDLEPTGPDIPMRRPVMATALPVTAGRADDWCDLVHGVAQAAWHDTSHPDLAVVRLHRDHPGTVLMVEAIDRLRFHRGRWGEPSGDRVDVRMPTATVERAIELVTACDRDGQLCVDADDEHVRWRTSSVRICMPTSSGGFPNLEKLRESVAEAATVWLAIDRQQLVAALDTAAALAATTQRGILRIEPTEGDGRFAVVVPADAGEMLHRAPLSVHVARGSAHGLAFKGCLAQQTITFLDGPIVTVTAALGQQAVYLTGTDREAVIMQTAG